MPLQSSSFIRRTTLLGLAVTGLWALNSPSPARAEANDRNETLSFQEGTLDGLVLEDLELSERELLDFAVAPEDLDALAPGELARLGRAAMQLGVCGNITLPRTVSCQVLVEGGCTAKCTELNFRMQCAAQLELSCRGGCNAGIQPVCQEKCSDVCVQDCTNVTAPKFDCSASCQAKCDTNCTEECKKYPQDPYCVDTCKAQCDTNCTAECDAMGPQVSCEEKCTRVCGAECKTQANLDCQVKCRGTASMPKCSAEMNGKCNVQCKRPEGALFCDSGFVDTARNIKACVSALNAYLRARVMITAEAQADFGCKNATCTGEVSAAASCSCTAANAQDPRNLLWALFALPGLMWATGRRSRVSCED